MNKSIIFCLGLLTGLGIGGAGTYFLVKKTVVDAAQDEIEEYAEHAERRIEAIRQSYMERLDGLEDRDKEEENTNPEEQNNEGVKKYHNYPSEASEYGANRIFVKERKPMTEETKQKIEEMKNAKPGISEITDEEFVNDENFDKQTIDFFFPEEKAYWGYGTDNQTTVLSKFGSEIGDLIGESWRWLVDYTDEDGIGVSYFRNENLGIDFEVIIHDSTGFNDRG